MDLKITAVASGVVEAERGEHRSPKYFWGDAILQKMSKQGER